MTNPKAINLTQTELKELFCYSPETGELVWGATSGNYAGKSAGTLTGGYLRVQLKGRLYPVHRLVYIHFYGSIPEGKFIDHIDGNKANNKIANLRLCSLVENAKNTGIGIRNRSGYKGVCWSKQMQKWVAEAVVNRKRYFLGHFDLASEAAKAYEAFAVKHHKEFYNSTRRESVYEHTLP